MVQTTKQQVPVTSKSAEAEKSSLPLLAEPYDAFERFLDSMFRHDWPRPFFWREPLAELMEKQERRMAIDVVDEADRILVRAEMPGIDKKDISVSMTDHLLTIKGSFARDEKQEKPHYYRREIARGSFERSVLLPENTDATKVEAALTNGVLEVSVAKAKESKRRSIEVK
ncbi:MAG TPA: Hsp20/alpha crystallin family protein [Burkholderiales bacterium]|nr:Hsp20/alpha crystallin family protein [Burkholderiales bacterium]